MRDRGYIVLLACVLTGLTLMLLLGHGPWAGHELFAVSESHGLNSGDVPVLVAYVIGLFGCVQLWRRRK